MPVDPSASAPRLHRDLRRLKAEVEAAGHRAYATLAGGLLVERESYNPNAPDPLASILIQGAPGCWGLRSLGGIDDVRSCLHLAFGLDPIDDPCPSERELEDLLTPEARLSVSRRRAITTHVRACLDCKQTLRRF